MIDYLLVLGYEYFVKLVQLSSQNSEHDEIDFEFLGNSTG